MVCDWLMWGCVAAGIRGKGCAMLEHAEHGNARGMTYCIVDGVNMLIWPVCYATAVAYFAHIFIENAL